MRKSMRFIKVLAIILAVALSVGILSACGKDDDAGSPAPGGSSDGPRYADSIEILGEANIPVVDPYNPGGSGGGVRSLYSCIYDRLIILVDGNYVAELATSWETSDAQTYTFTLRDDVYFHNGDKFTAQDVIDTFVIAKESLGSPGYETWRYVETITALDEHKVQMVLDAPNADFYFKLTMTGGSIVNKRARDADPVEGAWVGTGAFTLSEFASADYIVLTRNDDYWGGVMPTRQISFRYLPETAARTIALQNGDSQMSFNISPQDLEWFGNSPDFTVLSFTSNVINTLGFNMNHPILSDLNFRKAVSHALSNPEIAVVASGEWAIPVDHGTIWGWGTEFKNNNLPLAAFDLDLAKQYLADSIYNGEEIELISANPDCNRAAEIIQEQLSKIDINIKLYQTDPPTLHAATAYDSNKVEMIHYLNVFDNSSGSARAILYPFGAWNMVSYNNDAVNDLLDRAPTIADANERATVYRQIQEMVAEDMPYLGLYYSVRAITSKAGIGGIILNDDLNHQFRGIYLELGD